MGIRPTPKFLLFILALTSCPLLSGSAQNTKQTSQDSEAYDREGNTTGHFVWSSLAELPPPASHSRQPGLAGAFSGLSNGVLIIAGGANFPTDPPWDGGKKVWWHDVYALSIQDSAAHWERAEASSLEKPVAYGVSVTIPEGLLCIGGENEQGPVREVFLLSWDPFHKKVINSRLGDLPDGFSANGGFVEQGKLYVSGIQDGINRLLKADIPDKGKGDFLHWEVLKGCPGPPRKLPAYAAQSNGENNCLYLFGGRWELDTSIQVHTDGYSYDPTTDRWTYIPDVPPVMAAPAVAFGRNNILIFGGDDGERLRARHQLEQQIEKASTPTDIDSLKNLLRESFVNHPGFSRNIIAFNTITRTFQQAGKLSEDAPVTTNAILWNERVVVPSGEIKPGVRTSKILAADAQLQRASFGALNYSVLLLYFFVLIGIGIFFASRQKSTEDYFKGGGRIPWWAAGLSVFGTALSAITFMAIPAKTFATDWSYFFYNMSILLSTPLIVVLFIPFFRRLNITTAYEYLEQRFNVGVRLFCSLSFMLFQLGRIAIVLYLPAIALSVATGVDIYLCILAVGFFSIVYTLMGGIEAVIWTDVLQVIVLMGGALLALVMICLAIQDDFPTLFARGVNDGKFVFAKMNFIITEPTIWVVVIGGFFNNLITYSSDQSLVQRYLTTKDEKGAVKTAWTNALLVIPATLIFFGIGSGLYLYYLKFPQKLDPFTGSIDAIFPWYIMNELPAGVSGLLIAALFSAAMSSLSSSINSTSTAFTTDFFQRFKMGGSVGQDLWVAKISTLIAGMLGLLFALWMATFDVGSLWDQFFKVLGLFTGGIGGVFLLGVLFKKANGKGALAGLAASSVVQYFVSQTDLHFFLYAAAGLTTCVTFGYLVSIAVPDPKGAEGQRLTIHNKLFAKQNV